MAHHAPAKKREPVEKIALRVIVYGTAAAVIAACLLAIYLLFAYSLLPSLAYRLVALIILVIVITRVPAGIREVYGEVARRG